MTLHQLLAFGAAAFALSTSPCHAGPCSQDIERMQVLLDARAHDLARSVPPAPESSAALRHRQPTTSSIATAERELGALSPERVEAVTAAMADARKADLADDKVGCEQALADVQRWVGP
jgi:Asp-tRNA(Asn)/Glu-tRNA(Gln) amidotransferase A subunit family amidase